MPNQPRADNPVRYIRVEDQLWQRAQARADRDGVKVSAVVRAALEEYVVTERAPTLAEVIEDELSQHLSRGSSGRYIADYGLTLDGLAHLITTRIVADVSPTDPEPPR